MNNYNNNLMLLNNNNNNNKKYKYQNIKYQSKYPFRVREIIRAFPFILLKGPTKLTESPCRS